MRPNPLSTAFALGLVLAGTLQPALARSGREEITPAEEREFNFEANIPGCQAPEVLERLSTHFAEKEAKFWNSSLTILRQPDGFPEDGEGVDGAQGPREADRPVRGHLDEHELEQNQHHRRHRGQYAPAR